MLKNSSFDEFISKYIDLLFFLACKWADTNEEAEDYVQETFLKAHNSYLKLKPDSNVKSWLVTILRNVIIDDKRRKNKSPKLISIEMNGEEDNHFCRGAPETFTVVDLKNQEIFYDLFSEEIAQLLKGMPLEQQFCIILCDVEGMSYEEIAQALDCPVGTVRSRIHRGRNALQIHLKAFAQKVGYLKEISS